MKTITKNLYEFDELTEDAKTRARDWFRWLDDGEPDNSEIMDSLKTLFEKSGIKLAGWDIGHERLSFDMGDASGLSGSRAMAWLENNLLSGLRITREDYLKNRRDYLRYGTGYRIGKIKPCPLTGMCFDDEIISALIKNVSNGEILRDAYLMLGHTVARMMEAAAEYRYSAEYVDDCIRANGYTFDENGKREW